MSEDRRKNLRTQGKYSDGKVQKSRDKKQRSSLESKDSPEMRLPKRNSDGNKSANSSLTDENASSVKYEENSDYSFHQLEEVAKPTEIKGKKDIILSKTDYGESRILYEPRFLFDDEADDYFDRLYQTINFDIRNIVIRGVEYPQPRLVAWFGPFPYSYSGVTLEAAEMPDTILKIKAKVESYLQSKDITATFNSVLVNLYRDGKDSVAWHSDDEIMLGISPTIASVSLGETRKFEIRSKTEMKDHEDRSPSNSVSQYVIYLTHGSLVVMTGSMQEDWQHRVPKEYHDKTARINLTFRTVYPLEQVKHLVRKRRFSQRKSWPNTPRKKIRFDDFASPCSVSSYSRHGNKSYDELRWSNYNLSIDSENAASSEKHYSDVSGRKTSTERHEVKLMDDSDRVHETESSNFQEPPIAYKIYKNSRSTYHSTDNKGNKSGRKTKTERHRKGHESHYRDANESYDELRRSNYNLSIDSENIASSEKQYSHVSGRKTSTKRHEIKLMDDSDRVHEIESSNFQESPIAYKVYKNSRNTHLYSTFTTENKSYLSTDNNGNKSGKKTKAARHRKGHEIKLLDDTDLAHETGSSNFQESPIAYKFHKKYRSTDVHSAITNENKSYITDNKGNYDMNVNENTGKNYYNIPYADVKDLQEDNEDISD